jgi:hypothetical protein
MYETLWSVFALALILLVGAVLGLVILIVVLAAVVALQAED